MNYFIMEAIRIETYSGQSLPETIIRKLSNVLSQKKAGRKHVQREIALILCYVLRNGQNISE